MYMKTRNVWILAALLCGQIGVQAQKKQSFANLEGKIKIS